jgi:DNA-binding MarR family transcriptional regulator
MSADGSGGRGRSHPRHRLVPAFQSPVRLSVMACLAASDAAEFAFLRETVEVSDSSLSQHLWALEGGGFVKIRKGRAGRRPRTWASLTPAGRRAYESHMEALAAIAATGARPGPGQPASASEDCLFLNVTTPRTQPPGARLPVMVWWHGGGYTSGSGSEYDAGRMAAQGDVIVVTINYRLGVFGYFGLPGLPDSGDFGFADQIAALRWVKRNAAAFGGDPGNLTVFGESAGGMSACALLTSPQARGLVEKAAISSGSCLLNWPAVGLYPGAPPGTPYLPVRQVRADGLAAAKSVGCETGNVLRCMRGKPASALLPLTRDFADSLAYGTALLPHDPATAKDRGVRPGAGDLRRQQGRGPVVHGRRPGRQPGRDHREDLPGAGKPGVRDRRGPGARPVPAVGLPVAGAGLGDGHHRRGLGLPDRGGRPRACRAHDGLPVRVRRSERARYLRPARPRAAAGRRARHRPALPI